MAASSCTTWFWSDWLGDQDVRRLTPAERGVWIDLLALAAAAQPIGYVCDSKGRPLTDEEIGRVSGCSSEEAAKLIAGILEKGAASRDRTGRLFNRRMVRDAAVAVKKAEAGRKGGRSTAARHWGKEPLPQQVLQQGCRAPNHTLISKNSSSLLSSQSVVDGPQGAADRGSPAKSLADIARAKGWIS